jgi:hypothetical protein
LIAVFAGFGTGVPFQGLAWARVQREGGGRVIRRVVAELCSVGEAPAERIVEVLVEIGERFRRSIKSATLIVTRKVL